jgi:4-amino-4-deoxy-L-arabinose transferase-like glycosyltransferase
MGHALLMLVGLYLGVRKIYSETHARKVICVLGSSIGFLIGGEYINHDFLVATWITMAIGLFALSFDSSGKINSNLARLGFIACGFGFLSKGLIGVVLPGLVILAWLIATNQTRRLLRFPWISGSLLLCCVTLPWIVQVQSQFPDFLDYFIIRQHFSRFTGNNFNSQQAWWFYLPVISILMFPWLFILCWSTFKSSRTGFKLNRIPQGSNDSWVQLCWVWLIVMMVFFSIPKSKLIGYILPVIAPIAVLSTHHWDRLTVSKKAADFWFWCICGLSASVAVGCLFLARHNSLQDSSLDASHALSCWLQPDDKVYVAGDYPYDLPFDSNLKQPMIIVQDWDAARKDASDDWRRVFFEGADFDAIAGAVLQGPGSLNEVLPDGKSWLVSPAEYQMQTLSGKWEMVFKGRSWWVWRSGIRSNSNLTELNTGDKAQYRLGTRTCP